MAILRFLADIESRDLVLSSGLARSFSRDLTTIDPDGTFVDSNDLRFDETVLVAAVPAADEALFTGPNGYVLAAGVGANGSTELLLYLNTSNAKLSLFTDASTTSADTTLYLRNAGTHSAAAGDDQFLDMFDNGTSLGAKGLQPRCAAIFHGAIIVGGPLWVVESTGYEVKGWGFAIKQGTSAWSLVWDDSNQTQPQPYLTRGREWCLRAAPIYARDPGGPPTSCSMVCTDYKFGGQTPAAASARVFYFQISRSSGSNPWVVGAGTTDLVKVFDISTDSGFHQLTHAHAAMAMEYNSDSDPAGVQIIVSVGDFQFYNRFIRFTLDDYTSDYTTATWTTYDDFHGTSKPDATSDPGTDSMQPVGCAFGPPGEIIWGTDLRTEWITRMRVPSVGEGAAQALIDHLYGWSSATGHEVGAITRSWSVVFLISQPRPELSTGSLVTGYGEDEEHTGAKGDAGRILFCPDLSEPRQWAQVTSARAGNSTAAQHAGYIYRAGFDSFGLRRIPLPSFTASPPTLKAIRPILVAPGGKNLVKAGCYTTAVSATSVSNLTLSSGVWFDGSKQLPVAPSKADRGIKIRTSNSNSDGFAAQMRVSSTNSTDWNLSGFPWATTVPQVRRFRGWVLDGSDGQTSSINPNKTNQLMLRLWSEGGFDNGGAGIQYSCSDRWGPCTIISVRDIGANLGLGLRYNSHADGADASKDDNYGYLLIGEALDGNGSLPYPMAPEANGQDELLKITGMELTTEQSWSLKLALMMPVGNWDHHAARGVFSGSFASDRRWPLFTLWADDDNWIEFSANCEDKGFRVKVKVGGDVTTHDFSDVGGGKQVWLPDSPVLVAIGFIYTSPSTRKLYIGASLGGDFVKTATTGAGGINVGWSNKSFNELRFRGAPRAGFPQGEVCEMRIIGGEFNTSTGLSNLTLPSAFADLGFLGGP